MNLFLFKIYIIRGYSPFCVPYVRVMPQRQEKRPYFHYQFRGTDSGGGGGGGEQRDKHANEKSYGENQNKNKLK